MGSEGADLQGLESWHRFKCAVQQTVDTAVEIIRFMVEVLGGSQDTNTGAINSPSHSVSMMVSHGPKSCTVIYLTDVTRFPFSLWCIICSDRGDPQRAAVVLLNTA